MILKSIGRLFRCFENRSKQNGNVSSSFLSKYSVTKLSESNCSKRFLKAVKETGPLAPGTLTTRPPRLPQRTNQQRSFCSERAVRIRALTVEIVLCSWARHLTLTVPLSTQVYKWVLANCYGKLTNCRGVICDGLASHPGGSRNTPSRFMLQKPG